MGDSKKLSTSDDEEDLEALRLAALRTIKKKEEVLNGSLQSQHKMQRNPDKVHRFNRSNRRAKFFGSHLGRSGKNVQFNNRSRNTNLISIPTLGSEDEKILDKTANNTDAMTLKLPQHRYCKSSEDVKKEEGTSKFNRYNKSDESESESEEEEEVVSGNDSPGKLQKTDSLEALMQELDDEIQGKSKAKENVPAKTEKPKVKKIKKKKRSISERVSTSDSDVKTAEPVAENADSNVNNVEVIKHNEPNKPNVEHKEVNPPEEPTEHKPFNEKFSPMRKRRRSKSPVNRRGFPNRRRQRNFHKFQNLPLQSVPFVPPLVPFPPPVLPFVNPPFNPMFAPPNVGMITQPPPFFERPLSPLAINTESLTTATLAPLSPRSAAFVLENKAIIERRKRSPRRSYSRSRSRSRSPTPRRSPRRSISPRRSPRRLSRSPRRRSLSPRRRSLSPRRRNAGRPADTSPKSRAPVRERLGTKSKTEEGKEKPKETESSPRKDEKPLDPILEARKRKFESNEIKMKEGIIRLKPKEEKYEENAGNDPETVPETAAEEKPLEDEEETPKEPDVVEELENLLREDALLLEGDAIDLNPKVVDIFSDEDSASDNEGRFKVKERTDAKPAVLSFTKLVNGVKRDIKVEPLTDPKRSDRRRERRDRPERSRNRTRSPVVRKEDERAKPLPKKAESQEKTHGKSRVSLKGDRHVKPMERRFERKIEIKIKNPSKYERGAKSKLGKEPEEKSREEVKRKVEIDVDKQQVAEEMEEEEPEIIVESNSGDEENSVVNEGDLRAQLSKKRAEKLHRVPVEGISSRLLQNALQGAVFKKTKKKSKEQDLTSSDGKLPIHLRLGIANSSDVFKEAPAKSKRKSRRRKNREVLEQPPAPMTRDVPDFQKTCCIGAGVCGYGDEWCDCERDCGFSYLKL